MKTIFYIFLIIPIGCSLVWPLEVEKLEEEPEDNLYETSLKPNYFQYKIQADSNKNSTQDQFKTHQKFGKKILFEASLVRPALSKTEESNQALLGVRYTQTIGGRQTLSGLAMIRSNSSQTALVGLDYHIFKSALRTKIFTAYSVSKTTLSYLKPLVNLQLSLNFSQGSEIILYYKKSPEEYLEWPDKDKNLKNGWQVFLSRKLDENWKTTFLMRNGETKSIQSKIYFTLPSKNLWNWSQTQWENGKSHWSFQYSYLSNSKLIYLFSTHWNHTDPDSKETLWFVQSIKILLIPPFSILAGLTQNKDFTENSLPETYFLGFQFQSGEGLETIFRWRSIAEDPSKNSIQLKMEYRWN